jgi:hypothetical protein
MWTNDAECGRTTPNVDERRRMWTNDAEIWPNDAEIWPNDAEMQTNNAEMQTNEGRSTLIAAERGPADADCGRR